MVPLSREVRTVDSRWAIAEVIAFREGYTSACRCSYNAAIHRDFDRRGAAAGRRGLVPLLLIRTSIPASPWPGWPGSTSSVDLPMMVAGSSGSSYGIANLFLQAVASDLDREFRRAERS